MEWLHFCDFHIGGARGPQAEVLTSLLDQVRQITETDSSKIDAVFLVGDLTFSGKAAEYQRFTDDFLLPLREIPSISNAKFFAVPGNHDVECDKALPVSWEGIKKRNQDLFFCEDVDGAKVRSMRAQVFQAYSEFIEKNNLISPNPLEAVGICHLDKNLPVDIVAINTAFFSDLSEDSSKPQTPVPLASLRHLIKQATSQKPTLILGHHSPSSFLPEHERQLKTFLADKKAVLLHGHEHDPKATFNSNGTLRTLGFGATYVTSLGGPAGSVYVNSFARCRFSESLCINSYSWQQSAGRWIDTTETQFADCIVGGGYSGNATATMPTFSSQKSPTTVEVIASIPRSKVKPSQLVPIDRPNIDVWKHFFLLSENIKSIYQRGTPTLRNLPNQDEKLLIEITSTETRDLLILIGGINHILSSKEIESFNTTLDTEDYASVTVISLGKITQDAYEMYVRLKTRKRLEVLVNKQLTADADKILSPDQNSAIGKLETGRHSVSVLLAQTHVLLLVVDKGLNDISFSVIQPDGTFLLSSDTLISHVRKAHPEFAKMKYAGDIESTPQDAIIFDKQDYLAACYQEYNVVKYAALASIGIRFSDLPLEDLYVDAMATDSEDSTNNRLEAIVDDHLRQYPVSEALKAHIQEQLLTALRASGKHETSNARQFCQKYGAILVTGDPGSGKTCFIKNEILAYCKHAKLDPSSDANTVPDWYATRLARSGSPLARRLPVPQVSNHTLG